jgi:hypothetical protein
MYKKTLAVVILVACVLGVTFKPSVAGDEQAGGNPTGSPISDISVGPLSESFRLQVKGDYVAAGVGMRNLGSGTITISLPADSAIVQARLYWAIVRPPGPPASNTGTFNGTGITGTLVGTSGTPCWPFPSFAGAFIDVYRADVTGIAVNGLNTLTGFPSGLTNNAPPQSAPAAFPLLEGASLVVIFHNPLFDFNTVVIRDGAHTFANQFVTTAFGSFTPASATSADQIAQTTYIVADGQSRFPSDRARFNSVFVAGPGTGLKPADAFDGADGIGPVFPLDGLWDTLTVDVSAFFTSGTSTPVSTDVDASASIDCLTWAAQVLSVKTVMVIPVFIKPSLPIKDQPNETVPIAILSRPELLAAEIDLTSLTFGRTGDEQSLAFCTPGRGPGGGDENDDGIPDLVCNFNVQKAGFIPGDTVGILKGKTTSGIPIQGSIRIVP